MSGSETRARVQALVGRGMLAGILLAPPVLLADEKFVTPTKSDVEGIAWTSHLLPGFSEAVPLCRRERQ